MTIAPSIYGAAPLNLQSQLKQLEANKVEMLHVDIMDGNFVKNIAFGQSPLKALRDATTLFLDVHLMVYQPERMIDSIVAAGADMITVHAEATVNLKRVLQYIQKQKVKAGVALNPETSPEAIKYVLNDIDTVLVMTVNPGEGGQCFMEDMLSKIEELKNMLESTEVNISVDGSIDDRWANACMQAGATIFVAGSYIFNGDISGRLKKLQEEIGRKKKT